MDKRVSEKLTWVTELIFSYMTTGLYNEARALADGAFMASDYSEELGLWLHEIRAIDKELNHHRLKIK